MNAKFTSKLKNGKNFYIQHLENLDQIQDELSTWLLNKSSQLISHVMPLEDLESLPFTNKEIKKIGNPLRLTYWVVKPNDDIPIHIDGEMKNFGVPLCRLLIPVLNYKETETVFYSNSNPNEFEDFKEPNAPLKYVRPKQNTVLKEEERFILDTPIWMRIDKLHHVKNYSSKTRASFTVFYDMNTQLKYLPT